MLHHFRLSEGLLSRYSRLLCDTVIPFQEAVLNDRIPGVEPSHAIDNFRHAAALLKTGEKTGSFYGMVFQDSDVAKWLEAAAYSLLIKPDAQLEKRIDELCDLIADAQEEDGYLDTHFTLEHPERRFTNLLEGHELYCAGHMTEAAVALYEATGNRKLLTVMEKNADLLYQHFVEKGAEGYPGHPEIELALMRLWQATGKDKYKALAQHFVDVRGVDPAFYEREVASRDWKVWGNDAKDHEYQQSHMPVREMSDAVGHSVRAVYLYSAMADLAAVTGDKELTDACHRLFDSIEKRRMYITGGIGSTVWGEAFTKDYHLPNDTVYAETCASIGLIFFASRMLKLHRHGRYADVMERALYNTVLAGIELDGTKFFYVNPLEVIPGVSGIEATHRHTLPQRPGWFGCACCPPNVARLLTSLPKYIWEQEQEVLYNNLFAAGTLTLPEVTLEVETAYPFGDTVTYRVLSGNTRLAIHIPSFTAENFSVSAPGEYRDGYFYLDAAAGDIIELQLEMVPKLYRCNPKVSGNSGLGAVMVGPVVYCAEGVDNDGDVFSFTVDPSRISLHSKTPAELTGFPSASFDLGQVYTLTAKGTRLVPENSEALYFSGNYRQEAASLTLIPYFMWSNRGLNQMRLWFPTT